MGLITDLLKEVPLSTVVKERLALAEDKFNLLERENEKLHEELDVIKNSNEQSKEQTIITALKRVEIYKNRSYYDRMRPELFETAKSIRLCSIYACLWEGGLQSLLENELKKEKTIHVLIAEPSNKYVKGNTEHQLAIMDINTPNKIKQDLDMLKNIDHKRKDGNWLGRLEVKLYKEQPLWCIYIFDDELFAAPYLYRSEGGDTLCIHAHKIEHEHSTYDQFQRHFQILWDSVDTVNLKTT